MNSTDSTGSLSPDESAEAPPQKTTLDSMKTDRRLEKQMEQAFLEDRQTTRRLGWIATGTWCTAMTLLTAGGLLAVVAGEQNNAGLRYALVAISVPGLFCLLGAVVASVLWSRRSQRLTLESLQQRLAQIESMLRE